MNNRTAKAKSVTTISKLKKVYPNLYTEVKEIFEDANKKLAVFELDYFHLGSNHEFFLTLSSGVSDDLDIFEMRGEMIDDEISIHTANFDKTVSKEDFFNSDNEFIRDMFHDGDEEDEY